MSDGDNRQWLYIGTYTGGESGSEGIYACRFDPVTGALDGLRLAARVRNPTFLCLHPSRPYLYATNELGEEEGQPRGALSAYAMDGEGGLTFLNEQRAHGTSTCYVSVDSTGRVALVANYSSGTVAALPVRSDGSLAPASQVVQHEGSGPNPDRQQGPHAHSIVLDPSNTYALAADLGIDRVLVYRVDPVAGTLTPNDPPAGVVPPGSGPRHIAFHPNGRYVYVINEVGNTMTAFRWDGARGALEEIETVSTLPEGFSGTTYCADVHVAPTGRYVYGTNRGHDSIVAFRVAEGTGRLTYLGTESTRGKFPRNFWLSPDGRWIVAANQNSDDLYSFHVDAESGLLEPTGHGLQVPRPVCVQPARA